MYGGFATKGGTVSVLVEGAKVALGTDGRLQMVEAYKQALYKQRQALLLELAAIEKVMIEHGLLNGYTKHKKY